MQIALITIIHLLVLFCGIDAMAVQGVWSRMAPPSGGARPGYLTEYTVQDARSEGQYVAHVNACIHPACISELQKRTPTPKRTEDTKAALLPIMMRGRSQIAGCATYWESPSEIRRVLLDRCVPPSAA